VKAGVQSWRRLPSRRRLTDSDGWPNFLTWGRKRDDGLRPDVRSFPAGDYLILYRVDKKRGVLILRVIHGARDLDRLFQTGIY
jgi:hypothetical protein